MIRRINEEILELSSDICGMIESFNNFISFASKHLQESYLTGAEAFRDNIKTSAQKLFDKINSCYKDNSSNYLSTVANIDQAYIAVPTAFTEIEKALETLILGNYVGAVKSRDPEADKIRDIIVMIINILKGIVNAWNKVIAKREEFVKTNNKLDPLSPLKFTDGEVADTSKEDLWDIKVFEARGLKTSLHGMGKANWKGMGYDLQ